MNVFRTFHISKGSVYISCILLLLGFWFGTVKLLLSFPWISGFFCKKINPFHFFCINISSLLSFTLLISAGRIALFYNIWIFFLLFAIDVYRVNDTSHQLDSTTLNDGSRALCRVGSPAACWNGGL